MNALLLITLFILSCSKAEEPKQEQPQSRQQASAQNPFPDSPYYRYLDKELPLAFVMPRELGRGAWDVEYYETSYEVSTLGETALPAGFVSGVGAQKNTWFFIKLYDTSEIEYELRDYGRHAGGGNLEVPSAESTCYDEIPFGEGSFEGKKITQTLFVKQEDGNYTRKSIPATLDTYYYTTISDDPIGPNAYVPCPKGYPCYQIVHVILPKLPKGIIPEGKTVLIEARYTVTNPDEPQNVKKAKQKANEQICETLKNISWVQGIGTPPDWSLAKWPENYPQPRVSIEDNRTEEKKIEREKWLQEHRIK